MIRREHNRAHPGRTPLRRLRGLALLALPALGLAVPSRVSATESVYYVNDTSPLNDLWCTAPGSPTNNGLSSDKPLSSLQAVLDLSPPPGPGSTIYVDAGYYLLQEDLALPAFDPQGNPSNLWFQIVGANRKTIFDRQDAAMGTACFRIHADFCQLSGVTFRGADTGILIDPATCRNAILEGNTVTANAGYGIHVGPDPHTAGVSTYEFRNNLLHGNGGGLDLSGEGGAPLAHHTLRNNTIAVFNGTGIRLGGAPLGSTLENNIVSVKGAGTCLWMTPYAPLLESDYNTFHTHDGALTAQWPASGAIQTAETLSEWQSQSGFDGSSLSLDPLFVNATEGDFHLRSTAGSWHGGAWLADGAHSPCIDAGNPVAPVGQEPSPNGARVNQGAFGNTAEASHSIAERSLALLQPQGGDWSGVLPIVWSASGNGWTSNDTVRIEVYTFGSGLTVLDGASALPASGTFSWTVPSPQDATATHQVRVVCNQDTSILAVSGLGTVTREPGNFYVNDTAIEGDQFCTAPGSTQNDGCTPATPALSLEALLAARTLLPGDTVHVDAGYYPAPTNRVVGPAHHGTADLPVRIVGTGPTTVLAHTGTGANRRCLELRADFLRVEGLSCISADNGIFVEASSARNVELVGNVCSNHAGAGIVVLPEGTRSGEHVQLLQNLVVDCGSGLDLQGGVYPQSSRTVFFIENNTLRNPGTGIRLLNANNQGRLTNFLRNNIVETTQSENACLAALAGSIHYSNFNNFRFLSTGWLATWLAADGQTVKATFPTLGGWRNDTGQDLDSLSVDSGFQAPEQGDFRLQPESPCIDAGVIGYWMFDAPDAGGRPRIGGRTVDLGAYELSLRVSVRAFLQGPFRPETGRMNTQLAQSGLLPLQAPYAEDPRTAASIPTNATDWVLLQFRESPQGPTVLSRSVFLSDEGWILGDDGTQELPVNLPPKQDYHVLLKHRNHLAALTAEPLAFSPQLLECDFTQYASAYYGARAMGQCNTCALKRPRDQLYSSVEGHEERNGIQSRDPRRT